MKLAHALVIVEGWSGGEVVYEVKDLDRDWGGDYDVENYRVAVGPSDGNWMGPGNFPDDSRIVELDI